MPNYSTSSVMGFAIFSDDLKKINIVDGTKTLVNTINAHSFVVTQQDVQFKEALMRSEILLPDGVSFQIASLCLNRKKIKKIAGYDIFIHLLAQGQLLDSCKICFLGSSNTVLSKIEERMHIEYPSLQIFTYSPPFVDKFSNEDNEDMVNYINSINPDILFVGMTAPKQEKWVLDHISKLNVTIVCCIGAVFDFYAQSVKRPHKIFISLGLEWLGRFIQNPQKMWKRNFVSSPKFLYYLFTSLI